MCRCGLTGRGRAGLLCLGAGLLGVWASLPAAGRNEQSIGRTPLLFFGCFTVAIVTGTTFLPFPYLCLFFFSLLLCFFLLPCQLSLPRRCLWSWGKRPWVVQDEIDKGRRNYGAAQE